MNSLSAKYLKSIISQTRTIFHSEEAILRLTVDYLIDKHDRQLCWHFKNCTDADDSESYAELLRLVNFWRVGREFAIAKLRQVLVCVDCLKIAYDILESLLFGAENRKSISLDRL